MADWHWPKKRAAILWSIMIVCGLAFGGVLFAWSGLYNVAASEGHLAITRWFLEMGMQNSVKTHAVTVNESPDLTDADRISLGASAYQGGCVVCHGTLSEPANPIYQQMLPPPPRLEHKIRNWTPEQLFWIVKHGIRYAGMPAWVSQNRDDEVWSVVAFLRALPDMDAAQYQRLAHGDEPGATPEADEIVQSGRASNAIAVCARCHGTQTSPPDSALVPKLNGLPAEYMTKTLREYATGNRESGIMEPVAAELSDEAIKTLANYYSSLPPQLHAPARDRDQETVALGSRIANQGIPDADVPACVTCHAGTGLKTYPTLVGQFPRYIAAQLELWRKGLRISTPQGKIMAPIAERLTPQQIEAVAAYFGSLGTRSTAKAEQ